MIWTYRGEDILFFQGVVCSGMHSGNSWEALVICEDAIVFSLSGKYCIYLFQYFKTKLTFLILLASPLYFLLARGGRLFPASWTFNYKDKSISYFHQLPLSWNISWQYLLPFVVVEIINPRAFEKKWVKEEESDQYWKNWGLRRTAYWLGHREMRDQLNARKMWVSGEGTQIVSVRYEDRYGNRGFKSILEVRRRRIQPKSWHLPSCKGLSPSGWGAGTVQARVQGDFRPSLPSARALSQSRRSFCMSSQGAVTLLLREWKHPFKPAQVCGNVTLEAAVFWLFLSRLSNT